MKNKINKKYRRNMIISKKIFHRILVRKSNKGLFIHLIKTEEGKDKMIFELNHVMLKKFGWNCSRKNILCSYFMGNLFTKIIKEKNLTFSFKIDFGGILKPKKNSNKFFFLLGIIDGIKKFNLKNFFPYGKIENIINKNLINKNFLNKKINETFKNLICKL